MSQKTAKRIRRLEAQMLSTNAIMRTQMVRLDHLTDWVASAERTRAAQVEEAAALSRRSEARAAKRVRRWQWIAVSAVSSAVLVELIAAAIVHTGSRRRRQCRPRSGRSWSSPRPPPQRRSLSPRRSRSLSRRSRTAPSHFTATSSIPTSAAPGTASPPTAHRPWPGALLP